MKRGLSIAALAAWVGLASAQAPTFTLDNLSGTSAGPCVVKTLSPDGKTAAGSMGPAGSVSFAWPIGGSPVPLSGVVSSLYAMGNSIAGSYRFVGSGAASGGHVVPMQGLFGAGSSAAALPFGLTVNAGGSSVYANAGAATGISTSSQILVGRVRYENGGATGPWRACAWSGGSPIVFGPNNTTATVAMDQSYPFRISGVYNPTSDLEGGEIFFSDGTRNGTLSHGSAFFVDSIASVRAITEDGVSIVGYSGDSANTYRRAFLYNSDLRSWRSPYDESTCVSTTHSYAYAANLDASVIVGKYDSLNGAPHALVWFPGVGAYDLQDVMTDAGVNFNGCALTGAYGISRDGTVVVGTCLDTNQKAFSFSLKIPLGLKAYVPKPAISSVNPGYSFVSDYTSTTFDVYGLRFTPSCVLFVDGAPVSSTFISGSQLQFTPTSPVNPHMVKVVVTDPLAGDSIPFSLPVLQPYPGISSWTPSAIPAGSGDTVVTVYGINLIDGMVVYLNNDFTHPRDTRFLGPAGCSFVLKKDEVKSEGVVPFQVSIPSYGLVGGGSINIAKVAQKFQISLDSASASVSNGVVSVNYTLKNTGNIAATNMTNVVTMISGAAQFTSNGFPVTSLATGDSASRAFSFGAPILSGSKILTTVSGKTDQGTFSVSRVVTVQ